MGPCFGIALEPFRSQWPYAGPQDLLGTEKAQLPRLRNAHFVTHPVKRSPQLRHAHEDFFQHAAHFGFSVDQSASMDQSAYIYQSASGSDTSETRATARTEDQQKARVNQQTAKPAIEQTTTVEPHVNFCEAITG